jgi:hypothetical protein
MGIANGLNHLAMRHGYWPTSSSVSGEERDGSACRWDARLGGRVRHHYSTINPQNRVPP